MMNEQQKARIVELAQDAEAGLRMARRDDEAQDSIGFYDADEASVEAFRIAQEARP